MPLLMAIAEGTYLRTKKAVYLEFSKRWAKGTAILFAVGAVSGTVLSFELGLLRPAFMEKAGAIIGIFSGIFVVTANAWMNSPASFKIVDGKITEIDPITSDQDFIMAVAQYIIDDKGVCESYFPACRPYDTTQRFVSIFLCRTIHLCFYRQDHPICPPRKCPMSQIPPGR